MKINYDNIPEELQHLNQWVCWKYEKNPTNPKKPKKVPYDPKTGEKASVTDPETWGDFKSATRRLKNVGFDGIGFVFTENDPYSGTDLDNCRDKKTGKIEPWAEDIIKKIASYTEVTPSGTGVHIIVKGKLSGKGKKVGNIEIYDRGRYFTVTGKKVPKTSSTIKRKQVPLDKLYNSLLKAKSPKTCKSSPKKLDGEGDIPIIAKLLVMGNSDKVVKLFSGDWSDYASQSEAELALCSILSKVTDSSATIDRIFRGSGLMRPKWNENRGDQTYGEITIAKVLENPNKIFEKMVSKETSQSEIAQALIDAKSGVHWTPNPI